jgi:diguanylate cyclase (GGDEF)-like protein
MKYKDLIVIETRISNSFCLPALTVQNRGLLVKVYPASPLDRPIQLDGTTITVGRDETCEICLNEDSVSRRHASIESRHGQPFLKDLGSTNGTFQNEQRIDEVALQPGDRIRFGNQIFKYLADDDIESQYHEVIFKMMTTDGLTQVYNKRFLFDSLQREMRQAGRNGQPMCVLMMDLDKFKNINDTYGHLAGDAVLVEFAKRATSVLRSGEILARYGGEEFSILYAPATIEDAALAAERVRVITASAPVVFESIEIPMTVSIGIASYNGLEHDPLPWIAEADAMLYEAKRMGRNQVRYKSR